ncbi:hypothetical protein V6N11_058423 [Hibiscus sabdariffa]|uniref:Uncharacterized protein n=1 Tax=Hibiscus sabdariffa TaxID=183260 RepID=A0ABR2U478_9ROSI
MLSSLNNMMSGKTEPNVELGHLLVLKRKFFGSASANRSPSRSLTGILPNHSIDVEEVGHREPEITARSKPLRRLGVEVFSLGGNKRKLPTIGVLQGKDVPNVKSGKNRCRGINNHGDIGCTIGCRGPSEVTFGTVISYRGVEASSMTPPVILVVAGLAMRRWSPPWVDCSPHFVKLARRYIMCLLMHKQLVRAIKRRLLPRTESFLRPMGGLL